MVKTVFNSILSTLYQTLSGVNLVKLLTIYQTGAVTFTVVTISKVELSPTLNMKKRNRFHVVSLPYLWVYKLTMISSLVVMQFFNVNTLPHYKVF